MRIAQPGVLLLRFVALLGAALALASCGSGSDPAVPGPKRSMLIDESDVVILPTYRELAARAADLTSATEALQADPSAATLQTAQDTWREARHPWKQSEAFRFGPSESLQLRLRSKIDWSPVRPSSIEEEIAGTAAFTPDYIDNLGTTRRGFLALEYLLFDPVGGDAAVLDRFVGDDGPRRRDFLAALARDLQYQSEQLVAAWDPSEGDYRGEVITAGQSSATFAKLEDAIDEVVSAMVLLATTIEDKKIGVPAGIPSGPPKPDDVEASSSQSSITDILDNLQSLDNVYRCRFGNRSGQGLKALVLRTSPEIDFAITQAIAAARKAVQAIPGPLQEAVVDDPQALSQAYAKVRDLRLALAVDLVTALGATPRFTSDGD